MLHRHVLVIPSIVSCSDAYEASEQETILGIIKHVYDTSEQETILGITKTC
jgi:hypothetical protein